MTVWIVVGAVVAVLLLLLVAPIGLRLTLTHPLRFKFRITWLFIPVYTAEPGLHLGGRGRKRRKKAKPSSGKKKGFGMREGRAIISVLRTPGVPHLIWDTAMSAVDALELVRGELLVAVGFSKRGATGGFAALLAAMGARFQLGGGKLKFEICPDFAGRRFSADGELYLRTMLISWVALGTRLAFSKTLWAARRTWKEALAPPAPKAEA